MKTSKIVFSIAIVLLITVLIIGRSTIGNLVGGNVHFPEEYVNDVLTMEDGQRFTVFRRLTVDGNEDSQATPAVFKVRFRFKNLSIEANKRLSIIPAPFLMGMKAFWKRTGQSTKQQMNSRESTSGHQPRRLKTIRIH